MIDYLKGQLVTVGFEFTLDCHQMSLVQERYNKISLFYKMDTSCARGKGQLVTVGFWRPGYMTAQAVMLLRSKKFEAAHFPLAIPRRHAYTGDTPRGLGPLRGDSEMDKITRAAIIAMIDASTDYDASTITFHRDGSISAAKDADKTFNGRETGRFLVCYVSDFANNVNPFKA